MDNIDPNDYDFDIEDQFERMIKATRMLREIEQIQRHMRWQYGYPPALAELCNAVDDAKNGWMASNC